MNGRAYPWITGRWLGRLASYLSTHPFLSVYLSMYQSIYLSTYQATRLSLYLSICLVYLLMQTSICRTKWHLNIQKCTLTGNVLRAKRRALFSTSEHPKVVWYPQFLTLLSWTCASHRSSVHFVDISTSKKPSRAEVLCTFWLPHVLHPQRCAIFHLSSGQVAPHPLLQRAYFSTPRSHKSMEKSVSRLSHFFAHLHLLSSGFLFIDLLFSDFLF